LKNQEKLLLRSTYLTVYQFFRYFTLTRKAPGALDPAVFPPPLACKIQYGHSRYEPKGCKVLKLVIYLTIDVFAATPPPTSSLHPPACDNMNL